ncbi:MAG: hypothetical protein PHX30_05220 [Candidatus Pacebacteria bacterium]|nr:hypothetical protein [Candidatus Paceibacterota bacterium]
MDGIFLILGYGIPKDIFEDLEYRSYLAVAFNNIFEYARGHEEEKIHIIFCGGKTDMLAPYKRSEAGEMKKYFEYLEKRKFVKKQTRTWKTYCDMTSLSTLENLLNAQKIIRQKSCLWTALVSFVNFPGEGA